ncbi:MAG TPA: toxin-antitoxin system [Streptosporangiaceae bacterium]|nr:toxin-antitoxin system [Streptosporangiaceae bacterium]
MASLTIRGLDDETHARLRIVAARHGRSMEAEVRSILHEHLAAPEHGGGLGTDIHALFAAIGGADDLVLPERAEMPRAAELEA